MQNSVDRRAFGALVLSGISVKFGALSASPRGTAWRGSVGFMDLELRAVRAAESLGAASIEGLRAFECFKATGLLGFRGFGVSGLGV